MPCARTARSSRSSLSRSAASTRLRSLTSAWTHSQCRRPPTSTAEMWAEVKNSVPSFRRLRHSPCHAPSVLSRSIASATMRAFSSGG